MLKPPPPAVPLRTNRSSSNKSQRDEAVEAVWRSYWPYWIASIIAIPMLLFGLAVAGLEAANLEIGGSAFDASNVDSASGSVQVNLKRGQSLRIGVGIWSGATILVAAVTIFIINCAYSVKHWALAAVALVVAGATFAIADLSINSRIVAIGVDIDGFDSLNKDVYRIAAAQLTASSLAFLTCLVFLLMYIIVFFLRIYPLTKQTEPKEILRV